MLLLRITRSCSVNVCTRRRDEADGSRTCLVRTRRLLPGQTFIGRAEGDGIFTLRWLGRVEIPPGCYTAMRRAEVFARAWVDLPSVRAVARHMETLGFYRVATPWRARRYAAWLRTQGMELGPFPGGRTPLTN
jgi:hypothetical protein